MTYLIGIPFEFMGLTYYQTNKDVDLNTFVVVDTPHGTFLGKITKIREAKEEEMNKPTFMTDFPPILRVATYQDLEFYKNAEAREKEISQYTQKQSDDLNLNMKVLKSYLDIAGDKVLITFTSDGRVDFRELVKILNGMFRLKIELRQIGPRDQARLIGGIGSCGLPLCCSTFLTSFDGISIAMAKNQLLSINIPKLSGQCGKLMCCLKFEDEAYSKLRPLYPKIGEKFNYKNSSYEVVSLNVLSNAITAYNGESYETFTKEEFERVKKGLAKGDSIPTFKDINSNVDLSGRGVKDTQNRINIIKSREERRQEEIKNKEKSVAKNNNNNRNNHSNRRNNNNNNNRNRNYHPEVKKETGFIPVSQLKADSDILNIKGDYRKNDKK